MQGRHYERGVQLAWVFPPWSNWTYREEFHPGLLFHNHISVSLRLRTLVLNVAWIILLTYVLHLYDYDMYALVFSKNKPYA